MKTLVPHYYHRFRCTAAACRHTCCIGWEIEVDNKSAARFAALPLTAPHIESTDTGTRLRLTDGERCPLLRADGLCELIVQNGESSLCQICRDHPRFRNFWSDRVETGLGLVCEEAARLILSEPKPLTLVVLEEDGSPAIPPSEAELQLRELRDELLCKITESGPRARLLEYLVFRHLPNALYDDRVAERLAFIQRAFAEITDVWDKTDGSLKALVETARAWSYAVEYDDEVLEKRLGG